MKSKKQLNPFPKTEDGVKNDFRLLPVEKRDAENEPGEEKEIIRRLRIQNKKLQEQLTGIRKRTKQGTIEKAKLISKMDRSNELNHRLSEALGSCPDCWGEDADCSTCSGNGISGWRRINKRVFNVYVLPALEKLYGLSRKIK